MSSSTKIMKVIKDVAWVVAGFTVCSLIPFAIFCFLKYLDSIYIKTHRFSVRNATVVSFSYNTTATTFTYNLALFVTIPEGFESLEYIEATASYLNHRFSSKPDETLVEGFTGLRMRFKGEYVVPFTQEQLLTLNNNHMAGFYNVTIRLWPSKSIDTEGKIRLLNPLVLCDIQVPFQSRVWCDWTTEDDYI